MFMGTVSLFAKKLANNDDGFFKKFSKVRHQIEGLLVEHKDLIATLLQKNISTRRIAAYAELLFTDTRWPDFTPADLTAAVDDFAQRTRSFGGVLEIA